MTDIVPFGLYLVKEKSNVFVGGGTADIAHSRQFADIQLPVFVGGIVAEKTCGDVLFAYLRTPDLPSLCPRIFHPRPHTGAYHSQLQLAEYTRHL